MTNQRQTRIEMTDIGNSMNDNGVTRQILIRATRQAKGTLDKTETPENGRRYN